MTSEQPRKPAEAMQATVEVNASGAVEIYANGFQIVGTNGDLVLMLQRNGRTVSIVNLSYTLAKSIGEGMNVHVKEMERQSGKEFFTVEELAKTMAELTSSNEQNAKKS